MTNPLSLLTGGTLWKAATIGAGLITLILIGFLVAANVENHDLMKQRQELVTQITDPNTGYVAQLAQSRTNVATLTTQLDTQRKSFEIKAAEREKVLADTQRKLNLAQAKTKEMEVRLDKFLSTGPQGTSLEERVRDIDTRGLAEMVK